MQDLQENGNVQYVKKKYLTFLLILTNNKFLKNIDKLKEILKKLYLIQQ